MSKLTVVCMFVIVLCSISNAEIYKWKAANGTWTYSDTPPKSKVVHAEEMNLSRGIKIPTRTKPHPIQNYRYSSSAIRAEEEWINKRIDKVWDNPWIHRDEKRKQEQGWRDKLHALKYDPDYYYTWKQQWERDRNIRAKRKSGNVNVTPLILNK